MTLTNTRSDRFVVGRFSIDADLALYLGLSLVIFTFRPWWLATPFAGMFMYSWAIGKLEPWFEKMAERWWGKAFAILVPLPAALGLLVVFFGLLRICAPVQFHNFVVNTGLDRLFS